MSGARRRRILHAVRQYLPSVGGLEAYVAQLTARQMRHSDVEILTLNKVFDQPETLPAQEVVDGVPVTRAPFIGRRKLFYPFLDAKRFGDFDLIHIHAADQLLDLVASNARSRGIPYFVVSHGLFFHTRDYHALKKIYLRRITRRALLGADAVFAVSGNDQAIMREVGVESVLLRNPIEPLPESADAGDELVFIGRLSKNKRVDLLLDFLAALKAQGHVTTLHVVGSDTEGAGPTLEARAAELGVGDAVRFHGFVSSDGLAALLDQCRYVVSASEYEGFGLSIVEAMSAGLTPFLQDNAAFRETHERSGLGALTDFADPAAAAAAFLAMIARGQPDDRAKARDFGLTHSWDAVEETIETHYAAALSRRETTPA